MVVPEEGCTELDHADYRLNELVEQLAHTEVGRKLSELVAMEAGHIEADTGVVRVDCKLVVLESEVADRLG